jgi:FkbM family methyltransferase
MRARPDVQTVLRAVSDTPGTITLHLASFDQSSSVLPMGMHRSVYPGIQPSGTVEVAATPLDDLLQEIGVDPRHVSMLVIDVQGAEQLVLRGASRVLDCTDCVQVEISFAELYQGGAQIEDVEQTLSGAGLRRAALLSGFHSTWGDAFYVRGPTPPTAVHS